MANERIKLRTPPFRLSFPNVFQPSSYEGSTPKYSIAMLFYPDKFTKKQKKLYDLLVSSAEDALREKFKIKKGKKIPSNLKFPMRDGDEKPDLDGYGDGCMFASASSKMRPGVVDMDQVEIDDMEDIYAGCWCRATLTVYAYDNIGKGAAFGLYNLQKLDDDDSFSSRTSAEDDFADDDWDDDDVSGMKGAGHQESAGDDDDDDDDPTA